MKAQPEAGHVRLDVRRGPVTRAVIRHPSSFRRSPATRHSATTPEYVQ